jgi:formyl-CoA transferase/succinyl-CoA--D-citramalate CoA-transferase
LYYNRDYVQSAGPLTGVRVLELGSFIAGPFAGQLLGDYGAEVIKIEAPDEGDPMRRWGITKDGDSLWWPAIARNKRSVATRSPLTGGAQSGAATRPTVRSRARELPAGRLESWGIDYAAMSADNPKLVMVHVSGIGPDRSAIERRPGSAASVRRWAASATRPATPSCRRLAPASASATRWHPCSRGRRRRLGPVRGTRSGQGQEVDVAIYEAVAALMESTLADYELGGVVRARSGSRAAGRVALQRRTRRPTAGRDPHRPATPTPSSPVCAPRWA